MKIDSPRLKDMKLRDYFAAQAINLFSLNDEEVSNLVTGRRTPQHNLTAKFCYDLAEAMLKERASRR